MTTQSFIRSLIAFLKANIMSLCGLSVGMMITVLSVSYIVFESSYDKFHKYSDRIYLVSTMRGAGTGDEVVMSNTHHQLKDYIDSHVPQVQSTCRIYKSVDPLIVGQEKFRNYNGLYVDEEFFSIFDFKMLTGEGSVLADPGSIILTRKLAEKFFGNIDCLGKMITIKDQVYEVSGIVENPPGNSRISFEYLIPIMNFLRTLNNYTFVSVRTYFLTTEAKIDIRNVSQLLNGFYEAYNVKEKDQYTTKLTYLTEQNQHNSNTSRNFLLFVIISIIVLLVSVVNFVNIYAAQSELKIREAGVRRVYGATRYILIRDMLLRSVIVTLISAILGLILSGFFIESFRELSGVNVRQYGPGLWWIQVLIFIIALLTGLIAGIFPALRFSSSKVLSMINGKGASSGRSIVLRKVLVTFQYVISAGLMITLFVFFFQLRFLSHKDHGYSSENRMLIEVTKNLAFKYQSYISELQNIPGIQSISGSESEFGGTVGFGIKLAEDEEGIPAMGSFVQDGFFKTYGMKMLQGNTFEELSGRDSSKVIIDASTAIILGLEEPVGEKIFSFGRELEIIGVVADADFIAMKGERLPFIYTQFYDLCNELIIHYSGEPSVIAKTVADKLHEFDPEFEFNFRTVEEARSMLYKEEVNQVKIVLFAGIIALLVTIVGAYSMSTFMAIQRAKQNSIRKVMGATACEVLKLAIWEMIRMILIAFVVASPIAYLISLKWLENFTDKIRIEGLPFVLSLVILSISIFLSVYFKERQAAFANPVDNLRQN